MAALPSTPIKLDNCDITELLPHRGDMLMIDRLLSATATVGRGEKTFHAGHAMVCDGKPARSLLIEMMAQTLAALASVQPGVRIRFGMLVGVERATFHADAEVGTPCYSEVIFTRGLGGFRFATGTVHQHDRLLVEVRMRCFLAEEIEGQDATP